MSLSRACHVIGAIRRRMNRGARSGMSGSLLDGAKHASHRLRQPQPAIELGLCRTATLACQRIELGLAIVLRHLPFGVDESLLFHPVERGIQRPFLDPQYVIRKLPDPRGDAVSVIRASAQALEDQQVERALKQVVLSDGHVSLFAPALPQIIWVYT